MFLKRLFDLNILPEEPYLGPSDEKSEAKKKRRSRQRIFLTLVMYFGVWLGVIGQKLLSLNQANKTLTWDNIGIETLLITLIIATVIFPQVFPRVFAHMPRSAREVGNSGWRIVQFCLAFQQGFFWESLMSLLLIPKY